MTTDRGLYRPILSAEMKGQPEEADEGVPRLHQLMGIEWIPLIQVGDLTTYIYDFGSIKTRVRDRDRSG